MKFDKIIGISNNPKTKDIIREAEKRLSEIFLELSFDPTNKSWGCYWGGSPLEFILVNTQPHICDITSIQCEEISEEIEAILKQLYEAGKLSEADIEKLKTLKATEAALSVNALNTCATDGKRFYWNPEFIISKSREGLRICVTHENFHTIFAHPSRRGSRDPQMWNIAVDFIVNNFIIRDLAAREIHKPEETFKKYLGDYITLEEYAGFLRDPLNPPPRLDHMNPIHKLRQKCDPKYKHPADGKPSMFYADPELTDEFKKPEVIYDYLVGSIPKCPCCDKLGKYKKNEEYKKLEKKIAKMNGKLDA